MKKIIILIVLTIVVITLNSCKKYSTCCKYSAYNIPNDMIITTEDCESNLSKKELEEFKYNNTSYRNYEQAAANLLNYKDASYSCE